jgi:hypothetical protein
LGLEIASGDASALSNCLDKVVAEVPPLTLPVDVVFVEPRLELEEQVHVVNMDLRFGCSVKKHVEDHLQSEESQPHTWYVSRTRLRTQQSSSTYASL